MSAADAVARFRAAVAVTERPEAWIHLVPGEALADQAERVDARAAAGEDLPLAGVLVAVKDNIDVAGCPTTAAAPTYGYEPAADAPAVARLRAAGAVIVGKTNMDQFATGLVGTRSPYGAVRHAADATRISGGSSSGSGVVVAQGLVDLALGTDTAGSGRVPAALHGIWGLKPTRGLVPTTGVVPACASLDCVTVFGRDPQLAALAVEIMSGPDAGDPLSRRAPVPAPLGSAARTRLVVPTEADLGELAPGWAEAFARVVEAARGAGYEVVERSIAPLLDAARMLYESSFVAERYAAVGAHLEQHRDAIGGDLDPTVAGIVLAGAGHSAAALFADQRTLEGYRAEARDLLADAAAVLTPTTTWHPTLAQVAADPVGANSRMGRFTNFANQLDMAAVALPAGRVGGGEFGAMLTGHAFSDARLLTIARELSTAVVGAEVTAGGEPAAASAARCPEPDEADLFVIGAHRTGQPLNRLLTARGGRLIWRATTAPAYRLYALPGEPARPGMVLAEGSADGAPIVGEVWRLPLAGFGAVVAEIPAPLGVGQVFLADGSAVTGFLCQEAATRDCEDLSDVGDWVLWRSTAALQDR
ncbi:allophanate hydrolase [Demequina sp. NBRC 110057]|uniref:allophanate hydrolase n=1 Tax=Demequina sp. NBRC 110057 TaxID=1570346 RepID=UPI0009FF3ED0|nr:allophanate hydrolase [Demequina sp. NBRC 110057]